MSGSDLIHVERDFAATPTQVFDAWTKPQFLSEWLWARLGSHVRAEVDRRPRGAARAGGARKVADRFTSLPIT